VPEGLTAERLITAAKREGYQITRDQLKRWYQQGLLQRPQQSHPPGERGSASTYPPGTLEQLLLVCRLHREERRLDELRFDVWWDEGWVEPTLLRRSLAGLLDAPLERLRLHAEHFSDPHEAALAFIEQPPEATSASRSPVARLLRSRVERDDDKEQTAAVAILTVLFGGEPVWQTHEVGLKEPEANPIELVLSMLGMSRAASDRLDSDQPLLSELPDLASDLGELRASGLLNLQPGARVTDATDEELARALSFGRMLAPLIVVAHAAEYRHGRDAGGLGIFSASERDDKRYIRALFVWLALCLPDLQHTAHVANTLAALQEQGPGLEAVMQLVEAFPGYKQYLTNGGEKRLAALSDEERQQIAKSIDAYVAGHPTLRSLLADDGTIQ
jgi:hypothetical protein